MNNNVDINNSSEAYIAWDQSITNPTTIFSDTGSSTNFTNKWTNGGDWAYNSSGGNYQAIHTGADTRRPLTLKTAVDLSSYIPGSVTISWDQGIAISAQNQTQVPTGNGDTNGTWSAYPTTSQAWDCVNETTPNDSDYITGTTASGGYYLSTLGPFTIPAGSSISNLTVYIRSKDASSGTNNVVERIKVNGNCYDGNSFHDPGSSFSTYSYSWATNPATCSAWNVNDINGTGAHPLQQIGVYSTDLNPNIRISMVYAQVTYTPAPTSNDGLNFAFSGNGGTTWSTDYIAFRGSSPDSSVSYVIPDQYLTNNFMFRFYLVGFNGTGMNAYVDNIYIKPVYTSADGITISISKNGGTTYSDLKTYHANNTSDVNTTTQTASVSLPTDYLNDPSLTAFKFKITLNGFNATGENYYLDNIRITAIQPDKYKQIVFKINDQQVYLDGNNQPQAGSVKLSADYLGTIINSTSGTKGYSFDCSADVTQLVQYYSHGASPQADPPVFGDGKGKYTVGEVFASLGVDGNDSYGDQLAHAGWSLIIIYTSPSTMTHQIYLYDRFTFADDSTDLDFDKNGLPGGDINNFVIPSQTKDAQGNWETNAAQITCFVGEGDEWITGDFIALNAPGQYWDADLTNNPPSAIPDSYKLYDGEAVTGNTQNSPNNVWNSHSATCTADGVDVDTFNVTWASGKDISRSDFGPY